MSGQGKRLSPGRVFLACAVIFVLGLSVRAALNWRRHIYDDRRTSETILIARSLAQHGAFADAYGNSGPTAHSSPAYPILISGLLRIFGDGKPGRTAVALFSSTLAALEYALLPLVALACGIPFRTGVLGGALGALLPINYWVQTQGVFEYSLTALLVVLLSILYLRCWVRLDFSKPLAVWLGLVSGTALLTAPQLVLPLLALALGGWFLLPRDSRRSFLRLSIVQFAIAAAMLAPWALRNRIVLGSAIWSRSNSGLELHLSNNDQAAPDWADNWSRGLFSSMHPYVSAAEKQRVRRLGEAEYNRENAAMAKTWILTHPRRFAVLTVQRAFLFWFPRMDLRRDTVALAFLTVLGIAGLVWFWTTGAIASRFFLILWVSFAAPLSLFQASFRLRYPIEWTLYFCAAYGIVQIADRIRRLVVLAGGRRA